MPEHVCEVCGKEFSFVEFHCYHQRLNVCIHGHCIFEEVKGEFVSNHTMLFVKGEHRGG